MTTVVTRGAASAQALGYAARATAANYIEDVFSTYLYTGNSSTQTITNGINLSANGGLVWSKSRSSAYDHKLHDTARGITNWIASNSTAAQSDSTTGGVTSANSDGFSLGSFNGWNQSGVTYASWTFRKQAKFFDVVTYTGNGSTQNISHNLGSTPGFIIIKETSAASNDGWAVYHRSLGASYHLFLNLTSAGSTSQEETWFGNNSVSVAPNSTQFTVGSNSNVNANSQTYVAYLFAHDAGGFGTSGTDNVISCGTYAGNGSGSGSQVISLGYEPQFLMVKRSSGGTGSWWMLDNMRGATAGGNDALLAANTSAAETADQKVAFTATGFTLYDSSAEFNASGSNYIYIAIRRGPMRTPTSGTSVFKAMYGTGGTPSFTSTFPVDMIMDGQVATSWAGYIGSRLQGGNLMFTNSVLQEDTSFTANVKYDYSYGWGTSAFSSSHFSYLFSRAPGAFDVVCYSGNNTAARAVTHNLGVAPELLIVKARNDSANWPVYSSALGNNKTLYLNLTNASATSSIWGNTTATSSSFYVGVAGDYGINNATGLNYVAYLFASVAGVSKVGTYTGSGTTKQIDCGFTGGARFVLIKRTDSTGDWYVWDSTRGIVAGNDPYLLLNSSAAEVTNTDYIDTYSAGFEISSTAPAAINANGGTFIFLAIA